MGVLSCTNEYCCTDSAQLRDEKRQVICKPRRLELIPYG